ncbi:hypothetical protein E2C01_063384 [Portunus trituberculatus]|uniref:Uncharacterized protein n=1 Tax=Portunus trituberculatus TaxID=210409 RepID=A0A5B7HAB9_PORTR|nr:hypothetical protein [Portunus trituberculatus]
MENQHDIGKRQRHPGDPEKELERYGKVMEGSKIEGKFTRMVSEGKGKPKLVVNIEISKDGDLRNRVEGHNVLHFGC